MNDWMRLVFCAFAVYRLSEIVTIDDGPFLIFSRFREFLHEWSAGSAEGGLRDTVSSLFDCPYCLGVWFAVVAGVHFYTGSVLGDVIVVIFGIAGMQAFLSMISGLGVKR